MSDETPTSSAPTVPRLPTTEERLAELERVCAPLYGSDYPFGPLAWWWVTFGQVVSILSLVAIPVYAYIQLSQAAAVREAGAVGTDPRVWILVGAMVAFGYSAAMAVVFTRVKQLLPLD